MKYYSTEELIFEEGIFKNYENGYFSFQLNNGDLIEFEQINNNILNLYDLRSKVHIGKKFEIEYLEIIDDLDDEDFVILKLNKLKIL